MHGRNKQNTQKSTKSRSNNKAGKNSDIAPVGALTLDCSLYQHHLDNSDLTDAQKQEFLETLWSIMVSFVDLGFGIHPIQDAISDGYQDSQNAPCGQSFDLGKYLASDSLDVVKSPDQPMTEHFEDAADHPSQSGDGVLQKREEI